MEAQRQRRPTRPSGWAPALSAAVVLQAVVCGQLLGRGRAQDEPLFPSPLDFGLVDVDTETSTEQVNYGKVLVYGQMDIKLMQDIALTVRSALSMLCTPKTGDAMGMLMPVTTYSTQDILTLNKRVVGIRIDFRMLPALNGGVTCMDSISELSAGPEVPPFDPIPASVFRTLLKWEMSQHKPTMDLNTDTVDWRIAVYNLTCYEIPVVRATDHPTAIPGPVDNTRPQDRACDGTMMPEIDWASIQGSAWRPVGNMCEYAPNPCVCAAIVGCGWSPLADGRGRCHSGGTVSCGFCPVQPGCTPSQSELCGREMTPCSCAQSTGECVWDVPAKRCIVQQDQAFTPCSACGRQQFCPKLAVDRVRPEQLSVMGHRDVGWLVNFTFNRGILLQSADAEVKLRCTSPLGSLPVATQQLSVEANMLVVDLSSVMNQYTRDCNLVIGAGSVRDRDFISFEGYEAGRYVITVPDTAPPLLQSFEPPNSAVEVAMDATIAFTFSETVQLGSQQASSGDADATPAAIELMALGAERADGTRAADTLVATFAMDDQRVSFSGRLMMVSLSGVLQRDVLYSLSLPPAAIVDRSGNAYAGLSTAVYAFRTEGTEQTRARNDGLGTEAIIGIAVAVVGAALIVGVSTCIYARLHHVRKTPVLPPEDPTVVTVAASDPDAHYAWGGEKPEELGAVSEPITPNGRGSTGQAGSPKVYEIRRASVGVPQAGGSPKASGPRRASTGLTFSKKASIQSVGSMQSGPRAGVARAASVRAAWGRGATQPGLGQPPDPQRLGAAAKEVGMASPLPPHATAPIVTVSP